MISLLNTCMVVFHMETLHLFKSVPYGGHFSISNFCHDKHCCKNHPCTFSLSDLSWLTPLDEFLVVGFQGQKVCTFYIFIVIAILSSWEIMPIYFHRNIMRMVPGHCRILLFSEYLNGMGLINKFRDSIKSSWIISRERNLKGEVWNSEGQSLE